MDYKLQSGLYSTFLFVVVFNIQFDKNLRNKKILYAICRCDPCPHVTMRYLSCKFFFFIYIYYGERSLNFLSLP